MIVNSVKFSIRKAGPADWNEIWRLIEPVFRAGETYTVARDISETDARRFWLDAPLATFVAEDISGELLGTYFIRPNQAGGGSHVANCGYIVGERARGRGVASEMCRHSQKFAIDNSFRAMQFNFVVSSNAGAVRLWESLGFEIVGTLPGAFEHPGKGFVDAFVMYKKL